MQTLWLPLCARPRWASRRHAAPDSEPLRARQGLLKVDKDSRRASILAARVSPGAGPHARTPLMLTDDLDTARDGTVYFSDATAFAPPREADGSYDAMAPTAQTLLEVGHRSCGLAVIFCTVTYRTTCCEHVGMGHVHGRKADGGLDRPMPAPCWQAGVFSQARGISRTSSVALEMPSRFGWKARRPCNRGDRWTDPRERSSCGWPAAGQGHVAGARAPCSTNTCSTLRIPEPRAMQASHTGRLLRYDAASVRADVLAQP